ncbi:hypothetical protein G9A89_011453 [Geosiphon pyriformis]|nr:hypothetical protein G9A89_011453 [Geosiphon pyriformis]
MTYLGKFNKLLRRICQLETDEYYSNAQILDQFIAGLKDKLIKKVRPHNLEDLATAIRHAKNYEMAMEEANRTKLVNLAIGETSSAAEEKIDQLTKKVENYFTNQQQPQQQPQRYQPPQRRNQGNFSSAPIGQPQNCHYCGIPGHWKRDLPARRITQQNQFTPQNRFQNNNNRTSSNNQLVPRNPIQQRHNHYQTQPSYLTLPEEQNFQQTALFEGEVAAPRQNPSTNNQTIPPAKIAENTNLSDIFPFEFEANESPFLLSNAAVNEQKAITAMYTEAEVEGKQIRLILDSGSAGSIITYQLMQQLHRNVDRPAQTVIVTADAIQKQIHNEFKTAAGPTNTRYKLRAAFRLYNLFNTCKNVLQNPILQQMKIQYIGKLTELKFQQFSDQITSIIFDYYLNTTDSAWTSTELGLKEEIMLPVKF